MTVPIFAAAGRKSGVNMAGFPGNAFLNNSSIFSSTSNGTTGLFSCWARQSNTANGIIANINDASNRLLVGISKNSSGNIVVFISDPDVTGSRIVNTSSSSYSSGADMHILVAWDISGAAGAQTIKCYINDTDQTNITIEDLNLLSLGYAGGEMLIATETKNTGSASNWNRALGGIYFAANQYLDLDTESNRRKFISSDGKPVPLGGTGALPTGTQPEVYLSSVFSDFGNNIGSGGDFTVTGTLTNAGIIEGI